MRIEKECKPMNRKGIIFFFLTFILVAFSAMASRDTVNTYSSLRLYSGTSDSLFVDHLRYHGTFFKDSCITENFGTILKSTSLSGICWRRITNNFHPRFWAIGGQSPDNIIGSVLEEVDAINSAAIAAGQAGGDTIIIDTMYLIDRSIFLISNNTYLGTTDSAGFKRVNTPKTVLTQSTAFNDNRIHVANNIGFRTRQKINIANDQNYDSIAGHVSYTASVSQALGGDSIIFLSGRKMQKAMMIGDSVSLFFPMMSPRFTTLDSVYIKNLVFNGNRKSYNLNYDWRVNTTIVIPSTNESIIENCRFYEIPTENFFLCGSRFTNCSGDGFNGSVIHFSCNLGFYSTEVLYNDFTNTKEISDSIMSHSEAGMTFSAKVRNLRVAYNKLHQIGESGIGVFLNDDYNNEITDNLFNTNKDKVELSPFYTLPDSNLIYNNKNRYKADTSAQACIIKAPKPRGIKPCVGNSSSINPLQIGDTLSITLDSLMIRNSNENFLKCLIPIFDSTFFDLTNIEFNNQNISQYHQWNFDTTSSICYGAVFDNGHQNGVYGKDNWGYEPCSDSGKCDDIKITFQVSKLPPVSQVVTCPLIGLELKYDGEVGTWEDSITCNKQLILFDSVTIGKPFLRGKVITDLNKEEVSNSNEFNIYPNPANDYLKLELTFDKNIAYTIFNTIGSIQQEGKLSNELIDISNLSNGVYWIELRVGSNYSRNSFVKNKQN
jgi:hypothetical protein